MKRMMLRKLLTLLVCLTSATRSAKELTFYHVPDGMSLKKNGIKNVILDTLEGCLGECTYTKNCVSASFDSNLKTCLLFSNSRCGNRYVASATSSLYDTECSCDNFRITVTNSRYCLFVNSSDTLGLTNKTVDCSLFAFGGKNKNIRDDGKRKMFYPWNNGLNHPHFQMS